MTPTSAHSSERPRRRNGETESGARYRDRNSWQLLAWAIIASDAFAAYRDIDTRGRGHGEEDIDPTSATHIAQVLTGLDASDDLGGDDLGLGGDAGLSFLRAPDIDFHPMHDDDGGAHGSSTPHAIVFPHGTFNGQGAVSSHIEINPGVGILTNMPWQTGPEAIIPILPFFGGLDPFAKSLGFDEGIAQMSAGLNASIKGAVDLALYFADNPLMPIAGWQMVEESYTPIQFWRGDSFDVDWLVQATGRSNDGKPTIVELNGIQGAETSQTVSDDGQTMVNKAVLVDGGDWDGTLVVTGNYYEFNTIVQVNLLWDNDTVTTVRTNAEGPDGGTISTGNNVQKNSAQIINANGYLDVEELGHRDPSNAGGPDDDLPMQAHQMVLGGYDENFATIQLNNIVDIDQIMFAITSQYQLTQSMIDEVPFAGVNGSGHVQTNDSLMVGGANTGLVMMTEDEFITVKQKGPIQVVNGNYYEFNTLFQINIAFDTDQFFQRVDGDDAIASGGMIQFNHAQILQNDNRDDLFVHGKYSEYNLVLQVNALEDNDVIAQINNMVHVSPIVTIPSTTTTQTGTDGTPDKGSAVGVTLPSVLDDVSSKALGLEASST